MIKALSQKPQQNKVGQRRTLAHHRNQHSSTDVMPQLAHAQSVPQSLSISPDKSGIPREPTIQSCKHLNDFAKRSTFATVDSPFKSSAGKKTGHSKTLKPFNSAIKGATSNLERSLRKLSVVKRNISNTMIND